VDRDNLDKVITLAISGLSLPVSVYVLWRQRRSEGRAHFTAE
jgi:cbb3-type cytochrome oxidase subunit 3